MNPKAVLATAVVALLASSVVMAMDPRDARDLERNPPVLDPTPGLPVPVEPVPAPLGEPTSYEFHFVGVTPDPWPANRGVLNHSMACQAAYAGSRMCSVEDIQRTTEVPTASTYGHAWVRPKGMEGPMLAPHGGPMSFELPEAKVLHCRNWISDWSSDYGMAIDLGPEHVCYGGVHAMSCDQRLPVACCAPRPVRPVAE